MIGFLEGLKVTLKTAGRKPVTAEYPEPQKRLAVQDRYMGFPALLWDGDVPEPYCTGCMVCIRNCPTQCMSAQMTDNPKHAEGTSRRRKIISEFEINLGRCILVRYMRRRVQLRRNRDEPRARTEQVRAERQPRRPAQAAGDGAGVPGQDGLEADAAGKEQRRAGSEADAVRRAGRTSGGDEQGRASCGGSRPVRWPSAKARKPALWRQRRR